MSDKEVKYIQKAIYTNLILLVQHTNTIIKPVLVFIVIVIMSIFMQGCAHSLDSYFEEEEEERIVVDVIRKTATNIVNECYFQNHYYPAQGIAINNKTLYRLYDTGICMTYDITDVNHPSLLSTFELKSRRAKNHCNCAQILQLDDDKVYLYIAGLSGKCFVEQITPYASTHIQTITLPKLDVFNSSQSLNIICGDDGYLWMFGESHENQTLYFAKTHLPSIEEKEVVLSANDIVDLWCESNYLYDQSVWQGGMIHDGYLFFVFGLNTDNKHIVVYDTTTHKKEMDINLNGIVSEEPEDCDLLLDGQILLSINGGKGYYLIPFKHGMK